MESRIRIACSRNKTSNSLDLRFSHFNTRGKSERSACSNHSQFRTSTSPTLTDNQTPAPVDTRALTGGLIRFRTLWHLCGYLSEQLHHTSDDTIVTIAKCLRSAHNFVGSP